MAHCPNCNRKLHFWNIKAECPDCGISIPNYEWEKRLEEDAYKREEAFFKLHSTLYRIKYAAVGTPLRIIRLICAFLPIIGYVIPLASLSLSGTQNGDLSIKSISLITLFTNKDIDLKQIFSLLSTEKEVGMFGLLALGFLFLSLLLGVIAFFLVPLVSKRIKNPVHAVLHTLSLVLYSLSPFMLSKFCEAYNTAALGTAECSVQFGIYIGAALFALSVVFDIIVITRPVGENDNKYIPTDELQREYAISIGAIKEDE
ncbi:MAG: hypothetical protein ACI4GY_09335 [Acutalibacteraceae bacterium]